MITIYDWFGYSVPIRERYRLIREAGFDGVLMWWSEDFGRGEEYRDAPQLAREAGLIIENIHAPIRDEHRLWDDDPIGEALVERYLQCVADCAAYEIPTMVVHLPSDSHPHTPLGLDRVRRIAELAERLGVNVALENLRNFNNLSYVLEQVDSPRVGFCYDSGHHDTNYPDKAPLAMYGPRLMALHLHDNNGSQAQHGLPLDGTIDWPATMRAVAATGYTGATALEPMNWDYEALTPQAFLHRAYEHAQRLDVLRRSATHA